MADPTQETAAPEASVTVSVVICTYNREKFLPDALESLARQTAAPEDYEIVIVDNNSTDRTEAICRRFIDEHPHLTVRYVVERAQGLSHARNRGIAVAHGRYVTYLDDDAVAESDFVECVLHFFETHPDAVAVGGKIIARFEGERPAWFNRYSASLFFGHYDRGDRLFQYRGNGFPFGGSVSLRRDLLERLGGFNPELGRIGRSGIGAEEKELFSRIDQAGLPYYYDPTQVIYHQIDTYRTEAPYLTKIARGLGETHRMLYCSDGPRIKCARAAVLMVLKMAAAAGLGVTYLLRGRPAVSNHLLWYRWTVLRAFFQHRPD